VSEHSPEPWEVCGVWHEGDGAGFIAITDAHSEMVGGCWNYTDRGEPVDPTERDRVNARRIVACVNFCREFPTEALEGRQLVYLKQAQWESLADMPKFDGLMAVRKIDE